MKIKDLKDLSRFKAVLAKKVGKYKKKKERNKGGRNMRTSE